MATDANKDMLLACDFSGIQSYVLGVKSAGKAQAKRLRARSFLLELFEHAALVMVKANFDVSERDVLVQGGGGFLVRIEHAADAAELENLNADLQRRVWDETGGEVQVSLGWGETPEDARARLEYRKRRAGFSVMQNGGGWREDGLSQQPLGKPCDVCGRASGALEVHDEDDEDVSVLYCQACLKARRIGDALTQWEWMRPSEGEDGSAQALGVDFDVLPREASDAFRVRRWIPRAPNGHEALTFEEISETARGDNRLAVLKADVDDMGVRVGEVAKSDATYESLRRFSSDLHTFFLDWIYGMLRDLYHSIYTVYAGGDDLLLVGPWDAALDFAGALAEEFRKGPGERYGLTLSAGVALTPYRVPVRHAVERGEELLEIAKGREGKSSCAALDAVWSWDRHATVVGDGKRLADMAEAEGGRVPRSLLHRLLRLAESDSPSRAARWAYQTERNARSPDLRSWANGVLEYMDGDEQRASEAAASLRYALLATRGS